ncbi:MAG: hypothetical protein HY722_11620 [Planctomycetes bacterium]|nr:hypothetical protein [Planctomycetota bacterium]
MTAQAWWRGTWGVARLSVREGLAHGALWAVALGLGASLCAATVLPVAREEERPALVASMGLSLTGVLVTLVTSFQAAASFGARAASRGGLVSLVATGLPRSLVAVGRVAGHGLLAGLLVAASGLGGLGLVAVAGEPPAARVSVNATSSGVERRSLYRDSMSWVGHGGSLRWELPAGVRAVAIRLCLVAREFGRQIATAEVRMVAEGKEACLLRLDLIHAREAEVEVPPGLRGAGLRVSVTPFEDDALFGADPRLDALGRPTYGVWGLAGDTPFARGYARALAVIWAQALAFSALGVAASTLFSTPVASFVALALLVAGASAEPVRQNLRLLALGPIHAHHGPGEGEGQAGGGPGEGDALGEGLFFVQGVVDDASALVPDLGRFSVASAVAQGEALPFWYVLGALAYAGKWVLGAGVVAAAVAAAREYA